MDTTGTATQATTWPPVMWRVTIHCRAARGRMTAFVTEVVDVEAPENDLAAAARAGVRKLVSLRSGPLGISRIDVTRLDATRTPPSTLAQQSSLW